MSARWPQQMGVGLWLAAGLLGCDSEGGGGGPVADGGLSVPLTACVRDEATLAVPRACTLDEACACGAHCALGVCVSACAAAEDCGAGEICDRYGRCRAEGLAHLPVAVAGDQAVLTSSASALDFLGEGTERTVRLSGLQGRVRVVASEGRVAGAGAGDTTPIAAAELLAIRCLDGTWAPACVFEVDGPSLMVRVRAVGPPRAQTLSSSLTVFSGTQRVSIGVRRLSSARLQKAEDPPEPTGIYVGHAWPLSAGLTGRGSVTALPPELSRLRVAVTVAVYEGGQGTYVVSLVDDSGMQRLLPADAAVGTLRLNNQDALQLRFPAMVNTRAAGEVASVLTLSSVDGTVRPWPDAVFSAELESTLFGVTDDAHAPRVRWQLAVSRVRALPAGAQAPPPVAAVALPDVAAAVAAPAVDDAAYLAVLQAALQAGAGSGANTQRLLCDGEALTADLDAAAFGDLACADGGSMRAFPLFGRVGVADIEPLLGACLAELSQADPGGDPQCVDRGRLALALHLALGPDRDAALAGVAAPLGDDVDTGRALGHRLLQQWLGLHGFLVNGAHNVVQLADALAGAGEAFTTALDLADVYDQAIDGWDLVLSPRVAAALAVSPRGQLITPDYRGHLSFRGEWAPGGAFEQGVGLSVALVGAMRRQLQATRLWLVDEYTGKVPRGTVTPRARRLLRRAWTVMALAQGLHDNAAPAGADTPWDADWALERGRFASALSGLLGDIDAFERGANVLGIDDADLPLNHIGDPQGDTAQFSAASSFLLDGDGALVTRRVDRAVDALGDIRGAWAMRLRRSWEQAVEDREQQARVRAVHEKYGGNVWAACSQNGWNSIPVGDGAGALAGIMDVLGAAEGTACTEPADCKALLATGAGFDCVNGTCKVNPANCFLDDSDGACTFDEAKARARLSVGDVGYEMCFLGALRRRLGPEVSSGSADLDRRIDDLFRIPYYDLPLTTGQDAEFEAAYDLWQATDAPDRGEAPTRDAIRAQHHGPECRQADLGLSDEVVCPRGDLPSVYIKEARRLCASRRSAQQALRPEVRPGACAVTDGCPIGDVCVGGACVVDLPVERPPSCYLGTLGEAALAVLGAAQGVELARATLAEHTARYDVAMRSCLIAQLGGQALSNALAAHNDTMSELAAGKLAADIAANVAGGFKDTASADAFFTGGAKGLAAAAEAVAESASDGLAFAMDEADRGHAENMLALENDINDRVCFNDAEAELVGARASTVAVGIAANELAQRFAEKNTLARNLSADIDEGLTALRAQTAATVAPIGTDYWLAEEVERYRRTFGDAQRAVYLAMRAVEYEWQASLDRDLVLGARSPYALRDVVEQVLQPYRLNGRIAGGAPTGRHVVISLRRDLQRLASRADAPDGEQALGEGARFGARLADPSAAVFGADGAVIGYALPFTIYPEGTVDGGNAVGLLAASNCAERLWSINAVLVGDGLLVDSEDPLHDIQVRKRNTFASQWCRPADHAGAGSLQEASMRPSRNLFPSRVLDQLDPAVPEAGEADAFTIARVQAQLNVSLAQLRLEPYEAGASRELTGMGLYGDYTLFIPIEGLATAARPRGLNLAAVQDVLIRLDFLSVARQ